jgi:hypothetical protein
MKRTCNVRLLGMIAMAGLLCLVGCGKKDTPAPAAKPTGPGETPKVTPPTKETPPVVSKTPAGPDHLELIPADAVLFGTVQVGAMWTSDLMHNLRPLLPADAAKSVQDAEAKIGMSIDDIRRVTIVMLHKAPTVPLGIVSTAKPIDRAKLKEMINPKAQETTVDGMTVYPLPSKQDGVVYVKDDNLFFIGPIEDIKSVMKGKHSDGALVDARTQIYEHQFVVAANTEQLLDKIKTDPSPQMKGFAPLLQAKRASLTLDFSADLNLNAQALFSSEDEAKKAEGVLNGLKAMAQMTAGQMLQGNEKASKQAQDSLTALAVKQERNQLGLTCKATGAELVAAVKTAIPMVTASAGGAAKRVTAANNLKQIALAMHNYHDATGAFPAAAIVDKAGKPLLSWRVAILPYIEQQELYKQFKLDEPWDGPNNKKLLGRMPKTYELPGAMSAPNTTFFRVFQGPKAAFEGNKGLKITDFTDGTSNTFLVVEAGQAVPWTKPDPLPFDPQKPLPMLGALAPDSFLAVFADGAVHAVKKMTPEATLKALITRNAGDKIGPGWQK